MHGGILTVPQVADLYGVPPWRVRRTVDKLDADLPRAGLTRLIDRSLLAEVAVELQKQGLLPSPAREADHAED